MSAAPADNRLSKQLGAFSVYAIATGTTLSAGFFLLPGLAAAQAGAALPLCYVLAVIPLAPATLCKVELASAMPRAGGTYYFLDRSLGPLFGTVGGLGTWIALVLKTAFALVGMGAYINFLVPSAPVLPVALGLAVFFGVINLFGAKLSGSAQVVLVIGLLCLLTWFSGAGVMQIDPSRFANIFGGGSDGLLATTGMVYISYVGVTKVVSLAEEVVDPERNIPRGVIWSLVTAVIVYAVGTSVMVGVLPMEELAGDLTPAASAALVIGGRWGMIAACIAALIAFSSVTNAGVLAASRYPYAMSRDRLLPDGLGVLSASNVPRRAVILTVATIALILIAFDAAKIAKLASAFQLMIFGLICVAVVMMRESGLDSYDPGYKAPFYPWLPIIGIISPAVLIREMGWMPFLFSMGLLFVGVAWYRLYARRRVARKGAVFHLFERLGRQRFEGLDAELRTIMKEKGLREHDRFEELLETATVLDPQGHREFEEVTELAAAALSARLGLGAAEVREALLEGARMGVTPVRGAVALPHCRFGAVDEPALVVLRSKDGVDLAEAREPLKAIFFLLSPDEDPGAHLRALARIATLVEPAEFLPAWLACEDEAALRTLLRTPAAERMAGA